MSTARDQHPAPTPSRPDGAGSAHESVRRTAQATVPVNREAGSPVDGERTMAPASSLAASNVETHPSPPGFVGAGEVGPTPLNTGIAELAHGTRRYATDSLEPFKPFATGEIPVGELQRQARAWRWQRLAAVAVGSALGMGLVVTFFGILGLLAR